VYRSYGGENMKDRPAYYSKLSCLLSFLRAADEAGVRPLFLNDGPVPADKLELMHSAGDVLELPGLGMRGSYWSALTVATDGRWGAGDVVVFSEDDYLYRPESLVRLSAAADAIPAADYFALYADTPAHRTYRDHPLPEGPRGWQDPPPWDVDGQPWVRVRSTTSSFAARVGPLRQDLGIFRFCMFPHRTMLRDHDTCLLYQGFEPHSYTGLARAAVGLAGGTPRERLRAAVLSPVLFATNLRAHRRAARRRLLVAADPNLATHMESALLAPATDWSSVADETRRWATGRGRPTGSAV
jgi:hypothetical protein